MKNKTQQLLYLLLSITFSLGKHTIRQLCFITGLLLYSLTCVSQVVDFENDEYWVDAGVGGFSTIDEISDISWHLSVNLFKDTTFYKIKYTRNEEWDFSFSGPRPEEKYNSISLMIGKGFSRKHIQLQYLGGLGITGGIKRGKFIKRTGQYLFFGPYDVYEEDKFITLSIPLEVGLTFKPGKYIGIGGTLFGDLNKVRPYYGLALKLSVGKLR